MIASPFTPCLRNLPPAPSRSRRTSTIQGYAILFSPERAAYRRTGLARHPERGRVVLCRVASPTESFPGGYPDDRC